MRTTYIFCVALFFIAFALALANFSSDPAAAQDTAASVALQTTPAPSREVTSVIGSTDGIMLMGVIITTIITLPLVFRNKK